MIAMVIAFAGCAFTERRFSETASPPNDPAYRTLRGKYLSNQMSLFSVNFRDQGWRFLLMPDEFRPNYPSNYGNLYRVEELPRAFRELPRPASIAWRNDIYNAWIYPPQALEERVKSAARSAGVQFQLLPSLVH